MNHFESFNDVLIKWSEERKNSVAYTYLGLGDALVEEITFGELHVEASKIAGYLTETYKDEKTILLLFQSPYDFIKAFFGCLLAGKIAVPMFPPKANQKLERLLLVCKDAGSKVIFTTEALSKTIKERLITDNSGHADIELCCLQNALTHEKITHIPVLGKNSIAFLQYTSGSTGAPKGVIVTHGNLLDNEYVVKKSFGHDDNTVFAGWLPFFHDMGLVGNILQPFYLGVRCVLLLPEGFLQKPIRWLKAISDYKATTSGAPDFAFELCAARIKESDLEGLDLRSWTVAFNGAEPVKSKTIQRFTEKFSQCGFREESFYPCYGMAETTLIITGGDCKEKPYEIFVDENALTIGDHFKTVVKDEKSKSLIGCGWTWSNNTVKIVNPYTLQELEEGCIGEIWIHGNSVAKGYWNNDQATKEYFNATIFNTPDIQYLKTGDIGFIFNQHLFITGRIKDLIILRGKNYYPQDFEWVAESSHQSLAKHGNAAFSIIHNGEERLVIIQEVERTSLREINVQEVKEIIQQNIIDEFQVTVYDIVLVSPFSIPKTSSNKIQRIKSKQLYMDNSFVNVETINNTQSITQN